MVKRKIPEDGKGGTRPGSAGSIVPQIVKDNKKTVVAVLAVLAVLVYLISRTSGAA